jgi:long-chain acyl-CoA synthetase
MTTMPPSTEGIPAARPSSPGAQPSPVAAATSDRPWLANYEPGVPAEVEIPDLTVDGMLRRTAGRFPDRDALVFFGARTSFADLDRAVDRFAHHLRGLGLVHGDRVSLHLPTSPAFVIAFLGALRAGCIVSPMSPLLVERELELLLQQTRPRLSVTLDLLVSRVSAARAAMGSSLVPPPGSSGLIVTGIQDSLPVPIRWLYPIKARRTHRWNPVRHTIETPNLFRVIREAPTQPFEAASRPDDAAVLQPTGGTTGLPKAAVLTHRNLVANVVQCTAVLPGGDGAAGGILCALPYFHIYGLTVAMNFAILNGLTQFLHPRFEPGPVLKTIHRHRPRLFPGAPLFYATLIDDPHLDRYDIRSIEACISGAAPLPRPVQERFEALSGGRLCEGYGLTEASPVTHVNPIHGLRKQGTIGLPLPSTDARVMDLETGTRALGSGQVGELAVRGPQVMAGYWERPDETARVLRGGWLYTGDVATMDEDGYFTIVDRLKDLIIVGGANVYPSEIEEVLLSHPAVAEAAVVGMPDPRRGELPMAYVVLREGSPATTDELAQHCQANLSHYKWPARIEIRTELPKTMIGKVLRRMLTPEPAAASEESLQDESQPQEESPQESRPGRPTR